MKYVRISGRESDKSLAQVASKLVELLLDKWNEPAPDLVLSIGDIIGGNAVREKLHELSKYASIASVYLATSIRSNELT